MVQDGHTRKEENLVRYGLCFNDPKIDRKRTDSKRYVQRVFVRLDLVECVVQITEQGIWEVYLSSGRCIRVTGFAKGNPLERFIAVDDAEQKK